MGYTLLVDTYPDGEYSLQLADEGIRALGTFRTEGELNMKIMFAIFNMRRKFIQPEEQIIFSLLDDNGDVAKSKTVSVEKFITKYKGRVGALVIRPNNPANQAQELKQEEEDIRELIDWALEDGDRVAFIHYTEKLNKLLWGGDKNEH